MRGSSAPRDDGAFPQPKELHHGQPGVPAPFGRVPPCRGGGFAKGPRHAAIATDRSARAGTGSDGIGENRGVAGRQESETRRRHCKPAGWRVAPPDDKLRKAIHDLSEAIVWTILALRRPAMTTSPGPPRICIRPTDAHEGRPYKRRGGDCNRRRGDPRGRPLAAEGEKLRSRGAVASESCVALAPSEIRGRREGRVQAAPMARQQKEKLAAVTTGLAEHPAFPARRCYGLYVISPGTGLSCSRRRAARHRTT